MVIRPIFLVSKHHFHKLLKQVKGKITSKCRELKQTLHFHQELNYELMHGLKSLQFSAQNQTPTYQIPHIRLLMSSKNDSYAEKQGSPHYRLWMI